jgi:(p)ppGpp synthase/HD superfamily hydrolase
MPTSDDSSSTRFNELTRPLGPRFSEALVLAADIHRHQSRKGSQIPYIAHVIGVASLALEYRADEDEAIAALLHDAIEDAPPVLGAAAVRQWIKLKFGERVLEIVEGCTDTDQNPKPPWKVRKEQYVARIANESSSVLVVSIADKIHNVRALQRDYRGVGDDLWTRFNPEAGKAGTLGYYRGLATAYRKRAEDSEDARVPMLSESLDREVGALEDLVGLRGQWPLKGP